MNEPLTQEDIRQKLIEHGLLTSSLKQIISFKLSIQKILIILNNTI